LDNQLIKLKQVEQELETESKRNAEQLKQVEESWKNSVKSGQTKQAQKSELSRVSDKLRINREKLANYQRLKKKEIEIQTEQYVEDLEQRKLRVTEMVKRLQKYELVYRQQSDGFQNDYNQFYENMKQLSTSVKEEIEKQTHFQKQHFAKAQQERRAANANKGSKSYNEMLQFYVDQFYTTNLIEKSSSNTIDIINNDDKEQQQIMIVEMEKLKQLKEFHKQRHEEHTKRMIEAEREQKELQPILDQMNEIFEHLSVLDDDKPPQRHVLAEINTSS